MGSGYGKFKTLFNPGFAALSSIPRLDFDEFRGGRGGDGE
jgi:hypothetical protein